jgi:hypothetical protein
MPRFDQTGPVGKGPQTGGRRGVCCHTDTPKKHVKSFGGNRFHPTGIENDMQPITGRGFEHRRRKGLNGEGRGNRFRGGLA